MASRFDPLDKITPVRECWRIKVRIVRMWYLPSFNNSQSINSIEMVFMDEFGCTIHASVRRTLIYKFKPLLSEGQVYILAFFGVGSNTGNFRSSKHEFRLNFQLRTTVRASESDLIPFYGCKFVSFDEIFQSNGDFPFLVDVIGVLTGIGNEKEYEKDGKKVKMIVIEIEADRCKMDIALFGEFVDEVSNFLSVGEVQRPIVVIQFAKVKTFKGKTVLQNVMYGTRILFNPEIPEALLFRNSLPDSVEDMSQSLTMIPDTQNYSMEDDFLKCLSRKSIEELKDCRDDGFYVVFATVKSVNNGTNWWYSACKCNKAVTADSGMYYCDRCFCHVVNVVPRYRIKVRVMDESDSATFVIWDRDGFSIFKKSCSELIEDTQKKSVDVDLPDIFQQELIGKSFLFKVEVKTTVTNQFDTCFKVNRVCSDESIIARFRESDRSCIGAEADLTVGLSLADTSFSLDLQDIQSSISKGFNTDIGHDDFSQVSQSDVNVLDDSPAKMMVNHAASALDGEMSSTKLKKVKIEKD